VWATQFESDEPHEPEARRNEGGDERRTRGKTKGKNITFNPFLAVEKVKLIDACYSSIPSVTGAVSSDIAQATSERRPGRIAVHSPSDGLTWETKRFSQCTVMSLAHKEENF
jgi:hypothetical protein